MMIKEIDEESGEHGGDAVEGDEGFGGGEVVEHPGVDGEEEEWGEWVSESAIGSGEEGLLDAEDDEAEDGEEGTGGEAEAGVGEDGFEAGGEDEEGGDEGLEEEGVGGELVAWGEVGEAAEMEATRPTQRREATRRAPFSPKMWRPAMRATSILPSRAESGVV